MNVGFSMMDDVADSTAEDTDDVASSASEETVEVPSSASDETDSTEPSSAQTWPRRAAVENRADARTTLVRILC